MSGWRIDLDQVWATRSKLKETAREYPELLRRVLAEVEILSGHLKS